MNCERCGRNPASGKDVILTRGRFVVASLCSECLSLQARNRVIAGGAAALAALAAGVGAVIISERMRSGKPPPTLPAGGHPSVRTNTPTMAARHKTPFLNSLSRDLTQLALEGRLDPVIGRDEEIERIVRILARRTKNNPVLIGEAGVGKTAIVEGLAGRIVAGNIPGALRGRRILALPLAGVVAGTKYRGEFEARLQRVLDELQRNANEVIVFIDELHTIVGAGSAEGSTVDAANMLKPALARGDIRCIGATTFDEYRRYIENDAALERRFQPVVIEEPSPADALEMLRGVRDRYERHHRVRIDEAALSAAVNLSMRYISDRYLPDKAFDVLDEAASMVALRGDNQIRAEDIARVVSGWTGVPIETLEDAEARRLLTFEDLLRARVVGQEAAVFAVAEAVRRARAGIKEHRGPLAGLLFLGPTGVGKTELARASAAALFGSDAALLRFDMSEFAQPQSSARLVGAPPGYAGFERAGELTEAVRRRPYAVVLFDDVDRAHSEVLDLLLQILDSGRLTDAQGRPVDFRNALVILTATLRENEDPARVGERMSAELINRLDDAIVFGGLGRTQLATIASLRAQPIIAAAAEQGLTLEITQAALDAVAEEADDPRQGARLVRRVLERRIGAALARALLERRFASGDRVVADYAFPGGFALRPM
jgi:ATP-dependent Clp protease ATP-binding subunit ClpC